MPLLEKYLLSDYVRPGFPVHVGETTAPDVPMHAHDFYEVAFVSRGRLHHAFEHGVGAELHAGDFVLINPFERHAYRETGKGLHLVNLIFAAHLPTMLGQGLGQEGLLTPFHLPVRIGRPDAKEREWLAARFAQARTEFDSQQEDWRLAVSGILLQILALSRRILSRDGANRQAPAASRLTPVLAHIDARFTEALSLGALAKLAGLNASYLSELFHRGTGKTFKQYLTERRLKYALHLLEHGKAPVREVCRACGFSDLTHFERLVRRHTGKSPTDVRRAS